MDAEKLAQVRQRFLKFLPEFKDFQNPPQRLVEIELQSKRDAAREVRQIFVDYVGGQKTFLSGAEVRKAALRSFSLSGFLNWRDTAYLTEELFAEDGDWMKFASLLIPVLRGVDAKAWKTPLGELLDWLKAKGCVANISKLLPTHFLFFWDPSEHYCIKASYFDRFLKLLGEQPLGQGKPLTVESYERALAICAEFRQAIADWKPRDNIDIQSLAWVVGGGWADPPNEPGQHSKVTPLPNEPPIARPILDIPLNLILTGPPGTGKTHELLTKYAPMFGEGRYQIVTFHQSYSYEDFVEGIKPIVHSVEANEQGGQAGYSVQPGIFSRIVRQAMADPEHCYAIFIDEINRANISNVFGELITLLEPDKRMKWNSETGQWEGGVRVHLPYSHSSHLNEPPFGIPDNLYVIGTMNTADRSIALLDLALRRRFQFEEVMPQWQLLTNVVASLPEDDKEPIQLNRLLEAMNERIEYLYDRDHLIGHSYFLKVKSFEDLVRVFRGSILPLLQEYFYGDWHKIQLVLGDLTSHTDSDGRPKAHADAIVSHRIQQPRTLFGMDDGSYQNRRSYETSGLSPKSFRKIYETLADG